MGNPMTDTLHQALAALYFLAAGSGGFNTLYFFGYPAVNRGQRWGAAVLTMVCLGTCVQGCRGVIAMLNPSSIDGEASLPAALAAQAVVAMGSLAVSALTLRRRA